MTEFPMADALVRLALPNERLLQRLSAQAGNGNLRPEIPNVVTVYPGKWPISDDGVRTTAEGQCILGKVVTATRGSSP